MFLITWISILIICILILIKGFKRCKNWVFIKKKTKKEILNDILAERANIIRKFNKLPREPNGAYWEPYIDIDGEVQKRLIQPTSARSIYLYDNEEKYSEFGYGYD